MNEDLQTRREQAESAFSNLQTLIKSFEDGLRNFGLRTIDEARDEMNRLQGEHRVLSDLLSKPPADPSPVSPAPDVIDVDTATAEPPAEAPPETPIEPPAEEAPAEPPAEAAE